MSFSVQPDEIVGIADRVRLALDDMLERSNALRGAVDALSGALTGLSPARAAFHQVAGDRAELSRGVVSRGRAVVTALRSIVHTYIAADDDMAATTSRVEAATPFFDPSRFGRRPR
ncbi:hypothetical protein [Microbacterium sp. VKM Ac-2923]|uniref:hypothetical protein n=1 Tax=Microbacterium sp. VKM Ac-2923 TaxID=2929476 RepID=UPI001FB22B2C|nr:hypothetical protein [Microbacterium sp. VKM Ac-2923]MCJ1706847.1 hypothetical protein [Microbacterium sp. VKM Ac-2923]